MYQESLFMTILTTLIWRDRSTTAPIEVFHLPGDVKHKEAYTLCISHIRESNKNNTTASKNNTMIQWAAMYDVDEFLVLKKHKTIGGLVKDHCPVEQGCGGLVLNWYIFQSNGETAYRPIPVTKRFTYRFPLTVTESKIHGQRHTSIKSIVHVDSYGPYQSPHCHMYLYNRSSYDTSGAVNCKVHEKEDSEPKDDVAILNHYRTKPRREFYIDVTVDVQISKQEGKIMIQFVQNGMRIHQMISLMIQHRKC